MAKSSGHIAGGGGGSIVHNARNNFSNSVVFFGEKNEYSCIQEQAFITYRKELEKRTNAYTKNTGQKLQKKALTHLSLLCNLEAHHTLENLQPIIKHLEKELDTKVFQAVIHRDEGKLIHKTTGNTLYSGKTFFCNPMDKKLYFDEKYKELINLDDYEIEKNYHAHIEMMGIDSNGNGIKRNKLNTYYLSQFQTFLAKTLGMERGINYKDTKTPKVRHKSVERFKQDGVLKNEIKQKYLVKINQLKEELKISKENEVDFEAIKAQLFKRIDDIKAPIRKDILENFTKTNFENIIISQYPQLVKELAEKDCKIDDLTQQLATHEELKKENGAVRADYAQLEQLIKELKEQITNKDLNWLQ